MSAPTPAQDGEYGLASASCPQELDAVIAERQRCAEIVENIIGDGESVRFALHAIRNPENGPLSAFAPTKRRQEATDDEPGALAKCIRQSIEDGTFSVQSATDEGSGQNLADATQNKGPSHV